MDTTVRVTISDGRMLTGQLWCFDNAKNLILLQCNEIRLVQGKEHNRPLGPLVMVPGKHITKIEATKSCVEMAHLQAHASAMLADATELDRIAAGIGEERQPLLA